MMFKKVTNADHAREIFLKGIAPLQDDDDLAIEESDGRISAMDIVAPFDVPHYRRAAMDGFAVRASDTLGAGSNSPVMLQLGKTVEKGVCTRVHTGSPVPRGADAVVMLEDTVLHDSMVEIFTQVHPFKNVGEIGEDIQMDETIVKEGHRLRPCDIAVLASLGIENIKVAKKPRVAIIPTGEELVPRRKRMPRDGEVYETNGLMTDLYIRKWGGITRLHDIVTDDPGKIKEAITSALDTDLIIISGGTSVGKRDYVPAVVESMGELLVHGVGISPGKPSALGMINGKPVVCMPGYPVAGIVALYWFARPALWKLGRAPDEPEKIVRAILAEKVASRTGYKTFTRVRLETPHVGSYRAIPLATSGAGILSSVSKADGFVIIPENIEGRSAGEEVEVVLID